MYHPRAPGGILPRGVSAPTLTAFEEHVGGVRVAGDDQRRVLEYVLQGGFGADIIFGVGTTGEWNRVANDVRQAAMTAHADYLAHWNDGRAPPGHEPGRADGHARVPCWVGITAHTAADVLANLAHALTLPVDAAVLAPLSMSDIGGEPDALVKFFYRDVAELMWDRGRILPLVLYDNADIAADPTVQHLRTRDVKQLSRLDFIIGIKVTASRRVIGHYTKASAHFNDAHEFGIYVGNAPAVFDMFRPPRGWRQVIRERWHRFLLHGGIPAGVVPGYANLFPREWQLVWQACLAGDSERLTALDAVFHDFGRACEFNGAKKTLACLKRGLFTLGVISTTVVAPGTPALSDVEAKAFDERCAAIRESLADICGRRWTSRWPVEHVTPAHKEAAHGG